MPRIPRSVHLIALTVIIWVIGGLAFFPVPDGVPSTYAAVFVLFGGIVWVTFLTWRNAMSTDSVARLIYRTESEPARRARPGSLPSVL